MQSAFPIYPDYFFLHAFYAIHMKNGESTLSGNVVSDVIAIPYWYRSLLYLPSYVKGKRWLSGLSICMTI